MDRSAGTFAGGCKSGGPAITSNKHLVDSARHDLQLEGLGDDLRRSFPVMDDGEFDALFDLLNIPSPSFERERRSDDEARPPVNSHPEYSEKAADIDHLLHRGHAELSRARQSLCPIARSVHLHLAAAYGRRARELMPADEEAGNPILYSWPRATV